MTIAGVFVRPSFDDAAESVDDSEDESLECSSCASACMLSQQQGIVRNLQQHSACSLSCNKYLHTFEQNKNERQNAETM